ncbi:MAG: PEGA domain-containing protein, partial [Candidatus Krumholzibacteriaceae bacterium]
KAELERAKLVKEPELPAAKSAGPPAQPPKEKPAVAAEQAPATGFIDVAVDPPGEISIDGHQRLYGDHLPMVELPVGTHELVCRSDGRRDYVESVQIKRGELSRRRITLEEITGTLLLETPPGAQVFVDGVFKGTTPLSAPLAISAGTHRVEIRKAGFNAWTNAVFVPQDETVRLAISLVPVSVSQ